MAPNHSLAYNPASPSKYLSTVHHLTSLVAQEHQAPKSFDLPDDMSGGDSAMNLATNSLQNQPEDEERIPATSRCTASSIRRVWAVRARVLGQSLVLVVWAGMRLTGFLEMLHRGEWVRGF